MGVALVLKGASITSGASEKRLVALLKVKWG
jgi:hypothetical protein